MGTWLADLAGILHRVRGLAAPPLPSLGMEPEDGVPLRRRVGAAGIAACVSAVVVNPLDVVKTRIQAQAFNPHVSAATPFRHVAGSGAGAGTARDLPRPLRIALASGCPPRCPTTGNPSVTRRLCAPECNVYASSLDVVRKIVRQEGPLALFRGTAVALAIAVPTVGIYLPCYDICLANARAALAANDATKPWVGVAPALAGAASRTLAVLCVAPLDLARTRAQAFRSGGAKTPTGAVGVRVSAAVSLSSGGVSALHRSAGLSALRGAWTGTAPTLARDVPYSALYWFALERLRDDLSARGEAVAGRNLNANERLGVNFASGVVAGGGVAALTTPLDVVRTRHVLMSEGGSSHFLRTAQKIVERYGARHHRTRRTTARATRSHPLLLTSRSAHAAGVQGLFRGILPRTAYMAFGGVVYLGSYSYVTDLVTRVVA